VSFVGLRVFSLSFLPVQQKSSFVDNASSLESDTNCGFFFLLLFFMISPGEINQYTHIMANDSASVSAALRKQIEFYFSDSNFPNDKFLKTQAASNPEGFVPISTIASFKKVASLSSDVSVIAQALEGSEIITLSDDKTQVRRSQPLPEDDPTLSRSIYVKRFPETSTIDDIKAFFAPFGEVLSVRMRRFRDAEKKFKGSCYVEFATEEQAQKVLAKKDELEIDGQKATITTKAAHLEEEKAKADARATKRNNKEEGASGAAAAAEDKEVPKGVLLKLKGVPGDKDKGRSFRESVKGALNGMFSDNAVQFVDVSKEDDSAIVRFEKPIQRKEGEEGSVKVKIGEDELSGDIMTGEEEDKYLEQVKQLRAAAGPKGNNKRPFRGGKGGPRAKKFRRN
jgi:lupus La protein